MISQKIKSVVLDDNKLSRMVLVHIILKNCPEIEILEECETIDVAYKSITTNKPNLVIIGVEETKDIGFELLKMFDVIHFKIIFISDISDYALKAFRFAATDYLLKPVNKTELVKAAQKVQHELMLENSYQNSQISDKSQEVPGQSNSNLVIHHRKGFDVVKLSDIIYCEANTYCTNFYISGKKIICSSRNLKYFEELLPSGQFMRVHHSFIVNIQHVEGYSNHEEILLSENLRCSLSGSRKHAFLQLFRKP